MKKALLNFLQGRAKEAKGPGLESVPSWFFWLSMTITAICVAAIAAISVGQIPTSEVSLWQRLILLLVLIIFLIASLATTEIIPWSSRSWGEWRKPRVLGTIIYLALGATGFVAGVAGLFSPEGADKATQDKIAVALGVGEPTLVVQNINGVWGERGCSVTYTFEFKERYLKVTSLKDAPSMPPFAAEYSWRSDANEHSAIGPSSSTMHTIETKGYWPKYPVTFRYETDGSTERLIWTHEKRSELPLELVRCG